MELGNFTPDEITVDMSLQILLVSCCSTAGGTIQPKTGTNVTFNSGTGLLTGTGFSGNLTGTLQTWAKENITSVESSLMVVPSHLVSERLILVLLQLRQLVF